MFALELDPRCTFANFVRAETNYKAWETTWDAAIDPGRMGSTPLFIYGEKGVGKTHLLCAAGIHARFRGLKVVYTTAEDFSNTLVNAIATGDIDSFREQYQSGFLLIDDIHLMADKEREQAQEELLWIFNEFITNSLQIVVSSNRTPQQMKRMGLPDRLTSRLGSGLMIPIYPPDLSTKEKIMENIAERANLTILTDALQLIARAISPSEMEQVLNQMCLLQPGQEIFGLDEAEKVLGRYTPRITPEQVIKACSLSFGIAETQIAGGSRLPPQVEARHAAMLLMQEETSLEQDKIAAALGKRGDHSTVGKAIRHIQNQAQTDRALMLRIRGARELLYQQH